MININAPIIDKIKHTRLLAKQDAKKEWDNMRDKADDYMKGRTDKDENYTRKYLNSQTIEEVPIDNNNVTKRIIERISLVYSVEPLRTFFDDSGKEDVPSSEYIKATKFKNSVWIQKVFIYLKFRGCDFLCFSIINYIINFVNINPQLRNLASHF